ncbi:hypothetical protein GCM10028805_52850 [Spirosoma harenae]
MQRRLFTYGWYLTLMTLLVSCQDAPVATEPRYRLKSISSTYGTLDPTKSSNSSGQESIDTYTYDESGKLITQLTEYSLKVAPPLTTLWETRTLETSVYDAQGRLEKKDAVLTQNPDASDAKHRRMTTYVYDTTDRVTQVKEYSSTSKEPVFPTNFTLDYIYEYAYNGSSRLPTKLSKKTNTGWQFDPTFYYVEEYTYTDGNITTMNLTQMPTRLNQYTASSSLDYFQYDNKPNPYFGIGIGTSRLSYCRNNPITTDVNYTYDERGLLIKSTGENGQLIRKYEYETY